MLSWGLWLYSGFFSLGALAGEVKDPSRTFPLVIVIIMPLVATLNIWPLAVSIVRNSLNVQPRSGRCRLYCSDSSATADQLPALSVLQCPRSPILTN